MPVTLRKRVSSSACKQPSREAKSPSHSPGTLSDDDDPARCSPESERSVPRSLHVRFADEMRVEPIRGHLGVSSAKIRRKIQARGGASRILESDDENKNDEDEDEDVSSADEALTMYGKYRIPGHRTRGDLKGSQVFGFKTPAKNRHAPLSRRPLTKIVHEKDNAEAYFEAHGTREIETSDRTLARLKNPRLSQMEVEELLANEPLKYQAEINLLLQDYRQKFGKWNELLQRDFNLVLFGLGSKKALIQDFQYQILKEQSVVVVNGFFPSLTIKQILNSITGDILASSNTFGSVPEQIAFIKETLDDEIEEPIFLIIHNIDGSMLRNSKAQTVIAQLAEHPKIHLICSIDHINAPLIWDQEKLSKLNLVWFDTTTFLPYTEETKNENSLLVKDSGKLALNSLTHVFASLTPNAKGIYLLIINYQIQAIEELGGSQNYQGISFQELYMKSRRSYLSNSDLTLRAQLTEFIDHKLISIKKGSDGMDYLTIPLGNSTLNDFLELQK